jgi:N-acetylmuramoyl-L-alanine amidase
LTAEVGAWTDLGALNLSTVPKVMVEAGNRRNGTDATLMKSPAFQEQIAKAFDLRLNNYLAGR